MNDNPVLWEVRTLAGGLRLELRGGDKPALVMVHGSDRVRVDLADFKSVSRQKRIHVGFC